MRIFSKLKRFFGHLTVEPIGFFVMASIFTTHLIVTNLILRKVCLQDLDYPEETCANLNDGSHVEEQNAVQERATKFNVVKNILEHVGPFVFTLFLGPWSDIHGRKIPLVVFLVGLTLGQIGYVVNSSFMSLRKEWILILASLPYTLSGGKMVMDLCLFSYISDVSSVESRTWRISVLDVFLFGGVPVGNLLGAYLYQRVGFARTFAAAAGCTFTALVYCVLFMRDDARKQRVDVDTERLARDTVVTSSGKCTDVVKLTLVRDAFKTCLKPREQKKRTVLWLLFASILVAQTANLGWFNVNSLDLLSSLRDLKSFCSSFREIFLEICPFLQRSNTCILEACPYLIENVCRMLLIVFTGELGVSYLFTRRKFNWDELQHGFYLTLNYVSDTVGKLKAETRLEVQILFCLYGSYMHS